MQKLFLTVSVLFICVFGVSEHPATAQGVSPFGKRGAGLKFTDADLNLLNKSRDELLASMGSDSTRRWKNPGTGATGVTTLTRSFTKRGLPCRQIRYDIESRGQTRRFVVPYCQVKDGSWKIAF